MPVVFWRNRIEDYEILNLLQQCSYIKVFRAKCRFTSTVKVQMIMLKKKLTYAKGITNEIKQGIQVYSRLKHPAIVELYIYFEDDTNIYVVLKLSHYQDLQSYIATKGPLSEEFANYIFRKIVEGLLYLQQNHIGFEEITLKDIFLTRDLQVENINKELTINYTDSEVGKTLSYEQQQIDFRFAERMRRTPLLPNNPRNCDLFRETHSSRNVQFTNFCADENSVLSGLLPHSSKVLSQREQNKYDDQKISHKSQRKDTTGKKGNVEEAGNKLQVPPLNSKRLQPTRHRTKNAILTILDNEEVCIEFIRKKHSLERISEVCRISQDGLRIALYKPIKTSEVGSQPPPLPDVGADSIHSYESLPARHHRKYIYAARFVQLVKAKTPKITLYTSQSKCYYMENGPHPDCEVNFYDEVKVTRVSGIVKITEKANGLTYLEDDAPPNFEEYLEHYVQCYQRCLIVESTLLSLETATGHSYFPVIIGRRPASVLKDASLKGKENVRQTSNSPPAMSSFNATCSLVSTSKPSKSVNVSNMNLVKVTIPGIGMATQFPNQIIRIDYEDGSILTIIPENAGGGVIYNSIHGGVMEYSTKSDIPDAVKEKLRYVPIIIKHLTKDKHKIVR